MHGKAANRRKPVSRTLSRMFGGWRTGLPGPVIVLQAGTAVNYFGTGLILPFEIIYLHQARGFPTATAGAGPGGDHGHGGGRNAPVGCAAANAGPANCLPSSITRSRSLGRNRPLLLRRHATTRRWPSPQAAAHTRPAWRTGNLSHLLVLAQKG